MNITLTAHQGVDVIKTLSCIKEDFYKITLRSLLKEGNPPLGVRIQEFLLCIFNNNIESIARILFKENYLKVIKAIADHKSIEFVLVENLEIQLDEEDQNAFTSTLEDIQSNIIASEGSWNRKGTVERIEFIIDSAEKMSNMIEKMISKEASSNFYKDLCLREISKILG